MASSRSSKRREVEEEDRDAPWPLEGPAGDAHWCAIDDACCEHVSEVAASAGAKPPSGCTARGGTWRTSAGQFGGKRGVKITFSLIGQSGASTRPDPESAVVGSWNVPRTPIPDETAGSESPASPVSAADDVL